MILGVGDLKRFLGLLPFAAIIGLPIAFLLTALVGAPVLKRVTLRAISWLRAAISGAYIAAMMAGISIVIGRFRGLVESYDATSYSRIGGGDYTIEVDGILTAYGWYLLGLRTGLFIAFGAIIGLLVRVVIGPGRKDS